MHNAEVIPLFVRGGDWLFKRRLHPLDILAKPYKRRRYAAISARQRNAGIEVVNLHEATQRGSGPPWNKVYVDTSPKPGDIDVYRLQAEARLKRMMALVPREALPIINHVVFRRGLIWGDFTTDPKREQYWLWHLRGVLDLWADNLGY